MSSLNAGHFVVDCEYDGPSNSLISMAIVPLYTDAQAVLYRDGDIGREFYEVISPLPDPISEWVEQHVVPYLKKTPISKMEFQKKLEAFLLHHHITDLHYDWCDDIAYVNRAFITGPGTRIEIAGPYLRHHHHPDINYVVALGADVHNALSDARAIAGEVRQRLLTLA